MNKRTVTIDFTDGTGTAIYYVSDVWRDFNAGTVHITSKQPDGTIANFAFRSSLIRRWEDVEHNPEAVFYTEADLISFGEYLLSEERYDGILENSRDMLEVVEKCREAHQSDIENWKLSVNTTNDDIQYTGRVSRSEDEDDCACGDNECCYVCQLKEIEDDSDEELYTKADMKRFAKYWNESIVWGMDEVFEEWKKNQSA